ncbi:beta-adducin-like [Leuresthes tenuis]|uniref:beta-adducin-like n=1 Tax=Leuresthes tenuis TaxID=355514 RepID=UPI003B513B74
MTGLKTGLMMLVKKVAPKVMWTHCILHRESLTTKAMSADFADVMDTVVKVLVLRNHGIVALGESVEEAFYTIYHIQTACQIQGYRSGYAYRFPVLLERSRTRREVEVPATVTAFHLFDDDGLHPSLRQHPFAQRQQQERTRWLNTPNTYQKVSQEQASPGHQRTTWLKAEEVTQAGSTAIKIENPNQFVPLFTNPQEVIETRNKIRQQNRQDMKTAGPQSQVLASVITEESPSTPVSPPKVPPEPEPPNPFNQLTDQELEEYRKEVQRKQDGGTNGEEVANDKESTPATSPTKVPEASLPPLSEEEAKADSPTIQNGGEEEKQTTEELEKGMKALLLLR